MKLEPYKPNTQRTYIISIVSVLKSLSLKEPKKYATLYNGYYAILEKLNEQLKTNNEKSPKEEANWISQKEVLEKLNQLKEILPTLPTPPSRKKITEDQYKQLLDLVVLSLYSLQSPRRNRDYQEMVVAKKPIPPETILDSHLNVLDLTNNKFIFANFKTQKTYKIQEVPIESELREILDTYLKFHPLSKELKKGELIPFIVDFQGQPYIQTNSITRMLYKIFGGKRIGASMLRKIYLTDRFGKTMDDMKEIAQDMGTSTGTIQNHYIKRSHSPVMDIGGNIVLGEI
jgi:integrase